MTIETLIQEVVGYNAAIADVAQDVRQMNAHFEQWRADRPEFFTEAKGDFQ